MPAAGIYCIDLSNGSVATSDNVLHELVCYPWLKPCTCEPGECRVVAARDDAALCDAAGTMEQAWGGVTLRRAQLGVVAPLGFFNTDLPCGIGTTSTSVDQSVDDTVTGSCTNGLEGRLREGCVLGDELTCSCILTSLETHSRSTSHDAHAPAVSHDTRAQSASHDMHAQSVSHDSQAMSISQTVKTSCTDRRATTLTFQIVV